MIIYLDRMILFSWTLIVVQSFSSSIETAYQRRIDSMLPAERVARSAAMFQWTRDQLARQIVAERGQMDAEKLKWLIALRLYGGEPVVRELIERKLADVSG